MARLTTFLIHHSEIQSRYFTAPTDQTIKRYATFATRLIAFYHHLETSEPNPAFPSLPPNVLSSTQSRCISALFLNEENVHPITIGGEADGNFVNSETNGKCGEIGREDCSDLDDDGDSTDGEYSEEDDEDGDGDDSLISVLDNTMGVNVCDASLTKIHQTLMSLFVYKYTKLDIARDPVFMFTLLNSLRKDTSFKPPGDITGDFAKIAFIARSTVLADVIREEKALQGKEDSDHATYVFSPYIYIQMC